MKWIKLISYDKNIFRGTYIKFISKYPFENEVIMMFCQNQQNEDFPFSLITITGHKAGIFPFQNLPKECLSKDSFSVKKDWLINNWTKWIYDECDIEDIFLRDSISIDDIN